MHIGIDASRAFVSQPTGTENYSLNLIRTLAKIDRKNAYTLYVKDTNHQVPISTYPENFKFKVIDWPYLWTQGGLALECLRRPPDVLFIPAHTLPAIAITLRHWQAGLPFFRRPGLKTVVTVHDLGAEFLPGYHKFPQKLYLNRSTEYAVSSASRIIAVSKNTRDDLVNKLHCDPEKTTVIYEGYDSEKFKVKSSPLRQGFAGQAKLKVQETNKKYGIVGDYILFVGTVQPRKNLVRLIEAFSTLNPKPYTLVIVGKSGWMAEEIYVAPKRFGVEEQVRFLNYVPRDDLPSLYQNAICFVLPSLYEGFGLPVLEAMACGCPVVVSNTSSLPELVGEAGVLVDPYSTEDIAKKLQLIIANLQLRKELSEKGLIQVTKFSWEKCARETLAVLEKTR